MAKICFIHLTVTDFFVIDSISSGDLGEGFLTQSAGILEKIVSRKSAVNVAQDDRVGAAFFCDQNAIGIHDFRIVGTFGQPKPNFTSQSFRNASPH